MTEAIIALDQGTTSTRAIAFTSSGSQLGSAFKSHAQYYPAPGWVEQDPRELVSNAREVLVRVATGLAERDVRVAAVSVANQTETTVVWDRVTGEPIYNAIVWQDSRTEAAAAAIARTIDAGAVRAATGSPLNGYYSATKLQWILDAVPGARERAARGELAFGTIDTWLAWSLCEGQPHRTDVTNASRTLLFDIRAMAWSDDLLELFGIPRACLPTVQPCDARVGTIGYIPQLAGVPVIGMIGDQQAALVGQGALTPGEAKVTYGTGAFLLLNTGTEQLPSPSGLLSTVAYQLAGQPAHYALEGSVSAAGSLIDWLVRGLALAESPEELERLARAAGGSDGVAIVPAFSGLLAPYWEPDARGVIRGITARTTRGNIAYAAFESVALQVQDVVAAATRDGAMPSELRVDGGMSVNPLLMALQADVSGLPVVRTGVIEATAAGAARIGMVGVGLADGLDSFPQGVPDAQWAPRPPADAVRATAWRHALAASVAGKGSGPL